MPARQPKRLLLALLGEFVVDRPELAVRTGVFLEVLDRVGIAAPAARAVLDRLVQTEVLTRTRRGRELEFTVAPHGVAVLAEATDRVRQPRPFGAPGSGWTLVTFSLPEAHRTLRHRLRSTLTWEGFAPLRDGLWLAPGRRDPSAALELLRDELPVGTLLVFHADALDGFPIEDGVRAAWDIDRIREAHVAFQEAWTDAELARIGSAVAARTMLVADWLELLRADPGLPAAYMGAGWPASASVDRYRELRLALLEPSQREFEELLAPRLAAAR